MTTRVEKTHNSDFKEAPFTMEQARIEALIAVAGEMRAAMDPSVTLQKVTFNQLVLWHEAIEAALRDLPAPPPIRAHVEGCRQSLRVPVDLCECGGRWFTPDPCQALARQGEARTQEKDIR
jgi:hypothetical protein